MRKILATLGILLALLAIYFGSILPFLKAQRYIYLIKTLQDKPQPLVEIKKQLDWVINFYSPVGQEEVVRYIANDILNVLIVASNTEAVDREFVSYIEPHLLQYDIRHTLVAGEMYKALWEKYHKEEDYKRAEEYYKKTEALAPRLPQNLYSLFDLYRVRDDKIKMKEVGEIILKYWPTDDNIAEMISGLRDKTE